MQSVRHSAFTMKGIAFFFLERRGGGRAIIYVADPLDRSWRLVGVMRWPANQVANKGLTWFLDVTGQRVVFHFS